jgi:hypothetical protein
MNIFLHQIIIINKKMKKFMLDIRLEGLDNETRMKLLPKEQ